MNKVKNVDIGQALNILSVAKRKQLREVEKVLKFELDNCKGIKEKASIQKELNILAMVERIVYK